jgi:drug/metabolite transporter (DMT)-like permease
MSIAPHLRFPSTRLPRPSAVAIGPALGALTVLCWASFNVAAVHGIRAGLAPVDLSLLRFGVAGLVLGPAMLVLGRGERGGAVAAGRWPAPHRAVVLALLGGPLFGALAVAGYAHAPLSHGMVFAPASVFAVGTLLARAMNGERVRARHVQGGLVALGGLAVLAGLGPGDAALATWRGDVLFALAGAMWALFTALMRRWSVDPLRGTLMVGTASGVLAPPVFGVAVLAGAATGLGDAAPSVIVAQAFCQGLLGGILAVAALMGAARRLGTATAALLPSFTPVLALALAVPVLGDWPAGAEMAGVALAVAGLAIATPRRG